STVSTAVAAPVAVIRSSTGRGWRAEAGPASATTAAAARQAADSRRIGCFIGSLLTRDLRPRFRRCRAARGRFMGPVCTLPTTHRIGHAVLPADHPIVVWPCGIPRPLNGGVMARVRELAGLKIAQYTSPN